MAWERLTVEEDGPIVRVWLDRPESLNALDTTTLEEVAAVFDGLTTRFDVPVVVLGGRGRAFSAGADRKNPPARLGPNANPRERRHASLLGRRALEAIERCEAITIARLHGHVIGGALVLALGCDFRIAAASTSFHVPEVDLGIPLTWGAVPRLIREVGASRAKELILMCDRVDAATAERYGLVNRVVADDGLDATVDEWARRLAAKPSWALHMTTSQFRAYDTTTPLGDVTAMDGDLLAASTREDPSKFAFAPKRSK